MQHDNSWSNWARSAGRVDADSCAASQFLDPARNRSRSPVGGEVGDAARVKLANAASLHAVLEQLEGASALHLRPEGVPRSASPGFSGAPLSTGKGHNRQGKKAAPPVGARKRPSVTWRVVLKVSMGVRPMRHVAPPSEARAVLAAIGTCQDRGESSV